MKSPVRSFEKFSYTLRAAKNIERKMMCEAFARLSRIQALCRYRYIGMGSNEFCDFSLIHRRLGISDMISIERCVEDRPRFEFNRPYSCIKMKWGSTHEELPKLRWNKRCIVWLDFEDPLDNDVLNDIRTLVGCLRSGSIFVVTVKADPGDADPGDPDPEKRYATLVANVGKERVPLNVTGVSLGKWGLANASAQIAFNEIETVRQSRNGKLAIRDQLAYVPLFNFQYADGAQMTTVGGLLVDKGDRRRLNATHLSDLDFVRDHKSAYLIETPVLTHREIRHLDSVLPRVAPNMKCAKWLPEKERKKYGLLYRYFPSFSEVET
jgi:hypothetical protein